MTKIDTKELRKHIEQLQECSSKHSDVLHDLRSDFEDVNQYTQEILGDTPYGHGLTEILYRNDVDSLLTKMRGADRTFSYFKKSINNLHDDLDELEIELQNKVKMKEKVKAIKKGLKTFFFNLVSAAALIGIIPSLFMFAKDMANGDIYTGIIWALVATICTAILLTIWDMSD